MKIYKIISAISVLGMLATGLVLADTQGGIQMQGEVKAVLAITIEVAKNDATSTPPVIDWGLFALGTKWITPQAGEFVREGYTPLVNHFHTSVKTATTNNTNVNLSIQGTDAISAGGGLWEMSDTAGANAFALGTTAGHSTAWATGPIQDEGYVPIKGEGENLGAGANMVLDFSFDAPSSSSKLGQYTFGITILATAI